MNECNVDNRLFILAILSFFSPANAGGDKDVAQCKKDYALCRVSYTPALTRDEQCTVTSRAIFLLQDGANPNALVENFCEDISCAVTPLHLAVCKGNSILAKILLDFGAEPFDVDDVGSKGVSFSTRQTDHHFNQTSPVTLQQDMENHRETRCILSEAMALVRAKKKKDEVGKSL